MGNQVLVLAEDHVAFIVAEAIAAAPEECCGLLLGVRVGDEAVVREVRPAANVFEGDRRTRYELDARTHLRAQREARAGGLEVLGFYHSHPDGPACPSQADLERAWPGYTYLIVTLGGGGAAGAVLEIGPRGGRVRRGADPALAGRG